MPEEHGYDAADWPEGEAPPICEYCGIVVDRVEADLCNSCGCWFHPDCLSNHKEDCEKLKQESINDDQGS